MSSRIKVIGTPSFAAGTAVSSETASSDPDGVIRQFTGTLVHNSIQNSSVTFTAVIASTPVTATDNGAGVLAGTGITGTLNYTTGAWTLNYTSAPDNTTNITVGYTWLVTGLTHVLAESTGLAGAAGITKFRGKLANGKITPGTVVFHINFLSSAITITDNKNRQLIHEKVSDGYINYSDGSFLIFFITPPDIASNLTADYNHRNATYNDAPVKLFSEFLNSVIVYNTTGSSITLRLLESEDDVTYVSVNTLTVSAGSYKTSSITSNKYLRVLSWNNTGLIVEFYNTTL